MPRKKENDFCLLAEKWLQSVRPQIKESSYIKYKNILRSYINTEFRNTSVETLTPNDIYERCNHLLTDGGARGSGLSPKTVADILSVIRNILRYAHIKNLHPLCTGKEITIKQSPRQTSVLSHCDQNRLCTYLLNHMSERNLGILLCLFTGIRIGELCALKWEDISIEDETVHINKTMQRLQIEENGGKKTAIIVTTPKSACSIRTIPLAQNILHLIQNCFFGQQGYLLTGNHWKFTEPRTMQNHFRRILQENEIEPLNFHSLRHTFATRCVEVGFDIKSLSEILGHANVNITMNRYVHPTMELKKGVLIMKFDDLFEQRTLVGSKLKKYMRSNGFSKVALSQKADISRPTLDRILNGNINNKSTFDRHMQKIFSALQLNVDSLLFFDAPPETVGLFTKRT